MKTSPWLIWLFVLLSFGGFVDATFLTVRHYSGIVPCFLTSGCETVLTSRYAVIAGVPTSLLGALYYLLLLVLTISYLSSKQTKTLWLAAQLTWLGLLATAGLLYIQGQVLHAWCFFCLLSAAISILLFILGQLILRQLKRV